MARNEGDMKNFDLFLSALLLLAALDSSHLPAWGAEAIADKAAVPANYCHLKFPAIRENTLYSDRPVLKDPRDGDIIDFYGPCNYDPLGREEVMRQRAAAVWERNGLVDNN